MGCTQSSTQPDDTSASTSGPDLSESASTSMNTNRPSLDPPSLDAPDSVAPALNPPSLSRTSPLPSGDPSVFEPTPRLYRPERYTQPVIARRRVPYHSPTKMRPPSTPCPYVHPSHPVYVPVTYYPVSYTPVVYVPIVHRRTTVHYWTTVNFQ